MSEDTDKKGKKYYKYELLVRTGKTNRRHAPDSNRGLIWARGEAGRLLRCLEGRHGEAFEALLLRSW